ncbi:hypothetical protein [Eikenella corrodens]|uniref:hypothetical protein n=1 Tax=Eikenella corrodens TaxID=539 RepID=UPI0012BCBC75|nr:hypothetical protein [Eikenella corrodens]
MTRLQSSKYDFSCAKFTLHLTQQENMKTAMATCANSGFHDWIASGYLKIISSQIFFSTHPG